MGLNTAYFPHPPIPRVMNGKISTTFTPQNWIESGIPGTDLAPLPHDVPNTLQRERPDFNRT